MKIGIHQAYFLPYQGYFQLINRVDAFVLYDSIQYCKKGWINRNRIGNGEYLTLPLKKDSDYLNINQRYLTKEWGLAATKILNRVKEFYRKAPEFETVFPMLIDILMSPSDHNLFNIIHYSLKEVCKYLEIETPIILYSSLGLDDSLKGKLKVFEICAHMKADKYLNAIGGIVLYNKEEFREKGIELTFLKSLPFEYKRFSSFVPWLSILDLMMFIPRQDLINYLTYCEEV